MTTAEYNIYTALVRHLHNYSLLACFVYTEKKCGTLAILHLKTKFLSAYTRFTGGKLRKRSILFIHSFECRKIKLLLVTANLTHTNMCSRLSRNFWLRMTWINSVNQIFEEFIKCFDRKVKITWYHHTECVHLLNKEHHKHKNLCLRWTSEMMIVNRHNDECAWLFLNGLSLIIFFVMS